MIEIKNLSKSFNNISVLNNINVTINDGDIYGIIGMSGAGKSTLIRCINMLERPTEGSIIVDGVEIEKLNEKDLRKQRSKITMIFQNFNLLMQRNCLKNVMFPLEISGDKNSDNKKRALQLLNMVGLLDKEGAYPSQLSGGQQQRVAIARALATKPKILLCDEATSALDPKTTESILSLIQDINKQLGITVIIITHQMSVIEKICNRVAIIDKGTIIEEGNVSDVFLRPQSDIAKHFIFSENSLVANQGEKLIRIVFDGNTSSETPLIAKMAIDKNIMANIKYASTKVLNNKVYGNMILGIPDDINIFDIVKKFMQKENVIVEEL